MIDIPPGTASFSTEAAKIGNDRQARSAWPAAIKAAASGVPRVNVALNS